MAPTHSLILARLLILSLSKDEPAANPSNRAVAQTPFDPFDKLRVRAQGEDSGWRRPTPSSQPDSSS
jgi:hypothetical protein